MAKFSPAVFVMSLLVFCIAAAWSPRVHAEEPQKDFRDPLENFLKTAPPGAILKLKNPATQSEGMAELNKYFSRNAINKWVTVHTKAEVVEPTPNGRNAARIRAEGIPVKRDDLIMDRLSWLYFPEQNAVKADDVKVGTEITLYGQVRRCEVVAVDGGLRVNFDLWKSKIVREAQ